MDIYEFLIPDEEITAAVGNACEFFGLPEVPIVNSEGVCVWSYDTQTTLDDVFGVNREQLSDMGIISNDSITLAYTHECAHRALQSYYDISGKDEELACDFFSGLHAGLNDLDSTQIEDALGRTIGGDTHPEGQLRIEAIEYGKQVAADMEAQGIIPTFDNCMDRFGDFLSEHSEDNLSPVTVFERNQKDVSFTGNLDDIYDPQINSAHESRVEHHKKAAHARNYDEWEFHANAETEALHSETYWKDCKSEAECEHAKTEAEREYQDRLFHSFDRIEDIYKK